MATRATREPTPRIAPARRRVHVPTLLAGLLLVVGCALGFAVLTQTLSEQRPVVALSRPVARGTVLTEADLAVAQVTADSTIATLPADDRARLLGRTLLTSLPAGAVVTPDLVTAASVDIGPSARTVGLLLDPGGYPTSTLAPGDQVTIVDTGGAGRVLAEDAVVARVESVVDGSATRLVSIVVGAQSATAVTTAAAQDRARLLLHGAGS
ncbi:MAG TPA: SAF domain-containing protein [Euzebyales bacterium]